MNRLKILQVAKNKRGVGVKDFWYYDLEAMVKEGLLNKTLPKKGRKGRPPGWPLYIISRRGLKALEKGNRNVD